MPIRTYLDTVYNLAASAPIHVGFFTNRMALMSPNRQYTRSSAIAE